MTKAIYGSHGERKLMRISRIDDLHLYYVGNGKVWMTFPGGIHVNPDFISYRAHKVVELFGGLTGEKQFHSTDEITIKVDGYSQIGWPCYALTSQRLYHDTKNVRKELKEFLGVT
jgi:hypothetical protein